MLFFLFASVFASTRAGSLSGVVTLSDGKPASHAVVYLEGNVHAKPLKHVVVDQRDRKFIPHLSVVTVGTEVEFPNHDTVFHNVFTEYHSQKFDFGMYARGKTKRQVFDRPGLAVLLCSIHSEMSAYIMCVDTPYYAIADGKGRFELSHVAPGEYTLRVWQESGEKQSVAVHIAGPQQLNVRTER